MRRLLPLTVPLLLLSIARASTGGPDAADRVWTDADEPDGPPHAWLDASGGDAHLLQDDETVAVDLPFAFDFYGTEYEQVTISSNGVVFFDGATTSATPVCAGTSNTWAGVAAYWDDLGAGTVYTDTFGAWPSRTFVVSWDAATHDRASGLGSFQVWLLEGRDEVVVVLDDTDFGDAAVDDGASASVGVNASGGGLSWSCNAAFSSPNTIWFGDRSARPARSEIVTDELDVPWTGEGDFDYAGRALAAGDVNGDGTDDLLVGAQDTTNGDAYLLYRPSAGGSLAGGAIFTGESSGDSFGAAVALGDLDGDGFGEVIVGAPGNDDAGASAGSVYVWSAESFAGEILDHADDQWTGPASGRAQAGTALATGDVDGDGYADLLIGAPYADAGGTDSGTLYLVYGGSVGSGVSSLSGADATFTGDDASDLFARPIATGDWDADGADEVAVSATFSDDGGTNAGAVYVLSGARYSGSQDIGTAAGCAFSTGAPNARLGESLAFGDVDGSGLLDLLVGASTEDTSYSDAGTASVFLDPGLSGCPGAASSATTSITGGAASANLGSTVAAGDFDGDGVADLAVGAPNVSRTASSGGAAYIFTSLPTGNVAAEASDHAIGGSESAGALATAMAVADNADGVASLILTAPYASVDLSSEGGVYEWTWAADFLDEDGDGFVEAASGGNDCDDDEATAYPGGTDTVGDSVDGDCDGWVDGQLQVRDDADGWAWDLAAAGGDATSVYDFESGFTVATAISTYGDLSFDGELWADDDVYGAWASGEVAARVAGDSSVTITFAEAVDALALSYLDPSGAFLLAAENDDGDVVDAYSFELSADNLPGGAYQGYVFADSVTSVTIVGSEGWGLDDVEVAWSSDTDHDLDGYTDDEGDCDDDAYAVNPGVSETLGNGVDDDCDGIIDAGSATAYTTESTWTAAAGPSDPEVIDFEDVGIGEVIEEQYLSLGARFDGAQLGQGNVDGTSPNGSIAAGGAASVTLELREDQPALAFTLLDGDGTFVVTASRGGTLAYTLSVTPSTSRQFVGIEFDYAVDELTISGPSGDTWGLDDVTYAALGLDDADGDGLTEAEGDCDDDDATAYTGATETWYDGTDSDCSGGSDYDADGDGVELYLDCDDEDSSVSPDATETWYDGVDSDCSGGSDYDADGDGHDGEDWGGDDCDDADDAVSPDATETWYDGVDSDCAGDDDYDADGDGYSSTGGGGGAYTDADCDDTDADTNPGAEESYYDGVDGDCSGDEESDYDADGDGHDATAWGGDDCDDGEATAYPGATGDVCYDGIDTDCDEADDYDCDEDGYGSDTYGGEDCDDEDAAISPAASDTMGDGVDSDCDGGPEYDFDGDGHDAVADGGDDCDDADPTAYPEAPDTCYDGADSDCDEADDYDCDADGHASDGYGGDDCDDTDATISPSATDYWYDGVDQDCDGSYDYDRDGDGVASTWYAGTDCDDGDADVYPGAPEACYDGVDADCDDVNDNDCDEDGHTDAGHGGTDCDDTDPTVSPSGVEISGDGIDQDCDGSDVADCTDCDGDGHDAASAGGDDCDDDDAAVYPGAADTWYDGTDGDCAGDSDYDADADGADASAWGGADCDDADASKSPLLTVDDCGGGDEDCDGDEDDDCQRGDTDEDSGDTGDSGDSGDSGDTADSDSGGDTDVPEDTDWRPDPEAPVDPEFIEQDVGCGGCSTGTSPAGIVGLLAGLVGLRRRRG